MPMKNPPHIGRVIWNGILEPLSLSVTKAAEALGVRRATLSDLINGKAALTAEMALRIHKAFGPDVDHLLRMQAAYDAAQIHKRAKTIKVKRYVAKAA
jgi:addiction module HigA family antidote